VVGYLLVRGGTHIVAYAKALEKLTGTDLTKLFPIPDISNKRFPEALALEKQGLHQIQFLAKIPQYPAFSRGRWCENCFLLAFSECSLRKADILWRTSILRSI
jgi:hypothetical protein